MSSRECLNGSIIAKNIIIKTLEEALTNQKGFSHVRDSLNFWIGEPPPGIDIDPVHLVNKSEFLDSLTATIREYLSSLEETDTGAVRKRNDYVEEQLRMLYEELNKEN